MAVRRTSIEVEDKKMKKMRWQIGKSNKQAMYPFEMTKTTKKDVEILQVIKKIIRIAGAMFLQLRISQKVRLMYFQKKD